MGAGGGQVRGRWGQAGGRWWWVLHTCVPHRVPTLHTLGLLPCATQGPHSAHMYVVLCGAGYPNIPPLMELDTTGQGRQRFNPNLYADGKVQGWSLG